jgi:hypothetical protein
MRILLTGFTQRMVNSQRLHYDYLTSVYILRDALRKLGHEVEHRPVEYGEDLSHFKLALIGVGPPRSFTARHVVGSAWAVMTAKKYLLYCDDWSIANMGASLKTTLKNYDKYLSWFRENLGQSMDDGEAQSVKLMLEILYSSDKLRMLAPMFKWGDHKVLTTGNLENIKLVPWDPTPLVKSLPWVELADQSFRERQWVCATLQNHDGWVEDQRCGWPVKWLGNRRKGEAYVSEREVMQLYANSWGVLCPRYNRAGSGWWRVRYQWAAMTGAVLRCDPRDSCYMGEAYRLSVSSIEERDTIALEAVAQARQDWFFDNTMNEDELLLWIEATLQGELNG